MYHNKKIGVFISHIMGFYQKNVCQGIIDKALEYGYTAEIFASMDGENLGDYSLGEESILTLPNFDDLSGVIFASETYPNEQLKNQIYSLLKEKCHCPIMEVAVYGQQFPAVALENNQPFFAITEHLITEHQCRNICYFGCADDKIFRPDSGKNLLSLFKTVAVRNGERITGDLVILNPVDPVNGRVAGMQFFVLSIVGDQVKIIFRTGDTEGLHGDIGNGAVGFLVFHMDDLLVVDGGTEVPDHIDQTFPVMGFHIMEQFVAQQFGHFLFFCSWKTGVHQFQNDFFHFSFGKGAVLQQDLGNCK